MKVIEVVVEEFELITEIEKVMEREERVSVEEEKFIPSTLLLPSLTPENQRTQSERNFPGK
jgi:hypothetical protein